MPRLRPGTETKVLFSMRLHPGVLAALREAARDSADTLTGYVEQLLREKLRRGGYLSRAKKRGN